MSRSVSAMLRVAGLGLGLSGCQPRAPERLADCEDGECQIEWVEAHFPADPPGAMSEIGALADPIAQGALLDRLADTRPDAVRSLCAALPTGPARTRCESLNTRPHLWQKAEKPPPDRSGSTAGSRAWQEIVPEQVPCTTDRIACQTRAALQRAESGNAASVAGACLAIDSQPWRDECFFQAAERASESDPARGLPLAATLCTSAPRFVVHCLQHLRWQVAIHAPAASADAADWVALREGVTGASEQIAVGDAEEARAWASRTWASALRAAYEWENPVTGGPLDAVPSEAVPHVTCAAAWRLWNLEAQQVRTLGEWGEALTAALQRRGQAAPSDGRKHREFITARNLWIDVLPGEETFVEIPWLDASRRVLAADARGDALVCILEAAGHDSTPPAALLTEGLRDPDVVVRWTAARLLSAVKAPESRLAVARRDADPRVRARAWKPGSKL